ncbi:hypothetical protein BDR06DRAFT_952577 [Suillus hirtellus]|nr:hypothetical protein BDR06DRAFT_952577 [Suillus hirtellus]
MSEASFRLGQAPLTPRQVLQNIFAVSVLISTSTLYAASRPSIISAASTIAHAASNLVHAASNFIHAASNFITSTVTLSV